MSQVLQNYRRYKSRLLVVDSDPLTAQQFQAHLPEANFTIETAELGEIAWAKIEQQPPHVVVCAQRLPDISGLVLCQRLKANPHKPDLQMTYFLLLLSNCDPQERSLAMMAGVDSWLIQPLDPLEIQNKVKLGTQLHTTQVSLEWTNQRLLTLRHLLCHLGLLDLGVGCLNRQALLESMPVVLAEAIACQQQIICLQITIDNFAQLDATYGHKVMQEVLCAVSGRLSNNCHPQSIIYHHTTNAFLCLTAGNHATAEVLGQRLLHVISNHPISVAYGLLLPLTVSIAGIVCRPEHHPETCMSHILKELERLTQELKNAGGNRLKVCNLTAKS